jgi:hypothetical protein
MSSVLFNLAANTHTRMAVSSGAEVFGSRHDSRQIGSKRKRLITKSATTRYSLTERKKKTVIRSVRISQEVDEILEKDAKSKGVNVGALIGSIFTKYVEWDRYVEKLDHISMSRKFVRSILETVDMEKFMNLAEEQGVRAPKEAVPFWFKKLDIESFLA